jgi:Arc/MetJ-type ribon-helix-helix transcriptional regulator
MSKKEKTSTKWSIPVPRTLDEALEKAVRLDTHSTKSDFVRDAVRRKLEEMGFKAQPFLEASTQ